MKTEYKLLKRVEVQEMVGLKHAEIYKFISQGRFSRPIKISRKCVRWRQNEIENWVEAQPRTT